ncbi:MAG: hypothetical protein HYV15_00380 [Elusimicrobia bacterium]|nr:hypothetical protein [Elusimicrobiota bacterium]
MRRLGNPVGPFLPLTVGNGLPPLAKFLVDRPLQQFAIATSQLQLAFNIGECGTVGIGTLIVSTAIKILPRPPGYGVQPQRVVILPAPELVHLTVRKVENLPLRYFSLVSLHLPLVVFHPVAAPFGRGLLEVDALMIERGGQESDAAVKGRMMEPHRPIKEGGRLS